ncbi:MAG: response regulator [Deltaproteobacteria bacterium]|nr:response regulator [Deltaproteobacteria bacterium]
MNNLFMLLLRYSKKIVFSGVRDTHDSEARRKIYLINIFVSIGITSLIVLGITAFIQHAPFLGYADLFIAFTLLFLLLYLRYSGNHVFCSYMVAFLMNVFFCYLFFTGGVSSTAFMWLYTYPVLALFLLGLFEGSLATLLLFLFSLGFLFFDLSSQVINVYSVDFAIRYIPSFIIVFALTFFFERSRAGAHVALVQKQEDLTHLVDKLQKKEKQLELAQDKLEHRVVERTAELIEINKKLKEEIEERKKAEQERSRLETELSRAQKMEVLGRLAGGVAHDLNNVLSGIVSYPDLLLIDLPTDSPLREPLKSIKKSGERAAAIVQDLLALARRGVMVKKVITLNDVLEEYFQSPEYTRLCSIHPGIILEQHLDIHLQALEGSPVHLQKAIMNLLVNAFEAVESIGRVFVTTENRKVDNLFRGYEIIEKGNYVVLKIQDSGMGMSQEVLDKIFEPFYTKKQMGRSGTGLGMTVVWGTIKDHGGYLDIESKPGKGTTISLFFPVASQDIPTYQEESAENKQLDQGAGQSVLIVDDEVEQREIGVSILEKLGYRAWALSSGEEAVEFIKKQPVDLVLLDMIMPSGMDGLDSYRKILMITPGQKAVIVSGYSANDRVRDALELGIGAYLKKPYTIEQVSQAIHQELTR